MIVINSGNPISVIADLSKIKINSTVMLTCALGYILATETYSWFAIYTILGTFLIACSSAIINQIQERKEDAKMRRTQKRPLPSNKISLISAFVISSIFLLLGSIFILFEAGLYAYTLAIIAFAWYNLIYTPLKKRSAFAVIPGSIIGAIPPAIGWVSTGASLMNSKIIILCVFMFIWQIPHFWLLLLKHQDDYENADFPLITKVYSENTVKNITFVCIMILALIGSSIPFYAKISSLTFNIIFFTLSLALVILCLPIIRKKNKKLNFSILFGYTNIYMIFILFALASHDLSFS
ncbi:MAG: protoheme IX farnesyltransferase [Bacteroidales bacterium]